MIKKGWWGDLSSRTEEKKIRETSNTLTVTFTVLLLALKATRSQLSGHRRGIPATVQRNPIFMPNVST